MAPEEAGSALWRWMWSWGSWRVLEWFKWRTHHQRHTLESSLCRAQGQSPGRMETTRRLVQQSSQKVVGRPRGTPGRVVRMEGAGGSGERRGEVGAGSVRGVVGKRGCRWPRWMTERVEANGGVSVFAHQSKETRSCSTSCRASMRDHVEGGSCFVRT